MAFWSSPESPQPLANASWKPRAPLDRALPDFNCDGTRFRRLRQEFEALAAAVRSNSLRGFGLLWRRGTRSLAVRHGFGCGGRTDADNFSHAELLRSCPLGSATLAASELVSSALRMRKLAESDRMKLYESEVQEAFLPAAKAAVEAIHKAVPKPWFLLFVLSATRWPVLDFFAALERYFLQEGDCQGGGYVFAPSMRALAEREWLHVSEQAKFFPFGSSNFNSRDVLFRAARDSGVAQLRAAWGLGHRCLPRALQQALIPGVVALESGFGLMPTMRDPDEYLRYLEDLLRNELVTEELGGHLLEMPFRSYPVFGLWLYIRRLTTHRLELPPLTQTQLSEAFALPVRRPSVPGSGHPAFDALARKSHAWKQRRVVIATLCFGTKVARRLQLWLPVVYQVAHRALGVVVACFDDISLASCRRMNRDPSLCADTRDWPQNGISKIFTVLLCLQQGVDVLWLDMDTVVFHDPIPRLRHQVQEAGPVERQLLFSAEANSWTCVNNGVYFVRSTSVTRRHLAMWVSLYWARPAYQDQFVLYILLGLLPGMDFHAYAEREGLLVGGTRASALGSLRTPVWGTLDGRVDFTVPAEVSYGGVETGSAQQVAVLHTLESYPVEYLINQQYHDLRSAGRDILEVFLMDLLDRGSNRTIAMELLKRNQRLWREDRRDCRTSFIPGR